MPPPWKNCCCYTCAIMTQPTFSMRFLKFTTLFFLMSEITKLWGILDDCFSSLFIITFPIKQVFFAWVIDKKVGKVRLTMMAFRNHPISHSVHRRIKYMCKAVTIKKRERSRYVSCRKSIKPEGLRGRVERKESNEDRRLSTKSTVCRRKTRVRRGGWWGWEEQREEEHRRGKKRRTGLSKKKYLQLFCKSWLRKQRNVFFKSSRIF